MMYFDKFPWTTFELSPKNNLVVRDIIRSISLTLSSADEDSLFEDYTLSDGEKIENLSYKLYGSSEYHWVLFYINGFLTLNHGTMTDHELRKQCQSLYGSLDGLHHKESTTSQGEWVDEFSEPSIPVTNYEYMWQENEKKRIIKILKPEFLSTFVDLYMRSIQA